MGFLTDPTIRDFAAIQRNFDAISRQVYSSNGSPEGNQPAPRGSIYMRQDGGVGSSFYVKQSATSLKTGWVALA